MYWRISDFTEQIKQATGDEKLNRKTVATWFNKLEEEGIHYVNKSVDSHEKVYDDLDLQIGIFIKKKRKENWSLLAIFQEIKANFEVRPDFNNTEISNQAILLPQPHTLPAEFDIQLLKQELLSEIRNAYQEVAASQYIQLQNIYELYSKATQTPSLNVDEREKRFQDIILRKRIEHQLEKEAHQLWIAKPKAERLKRKGWFRKEEDNLLRDLFIKDYINQHFAQRIYQEFHYINRTKS